MLPVILFVAFWVVSGFALFFVAASGGPAAARERLQTQTHGGKRVITILFVIIYVGFGVAMPLAFLTGNHAKASAQVGGLKLNRAERTGRELFGEHCGVCHTLAAANAIGKVGPNLDTIAPSDQLTLHTVQYGCLQNAPTGSQETCLGQGTMPAGLLQGQQARQVAAFVARVAGKE